jgi:hypothetical protein
MHAAELDELTSAAIWTVAYAAVRDEGGAPAEYPLSAATVAHITNGEDIDPGATPRADMRSLSLLGFMALVGEQLMTEERRAQVN